MTIDVLVDNDGIIDDQAQRDEKGKQGDHVNGVAEIEDRDHGKQERHRDAHGSDQGNPKIQEQVQRQQHQEQADQPRGLHRVEARLHVGREVVEHADLDGGGQLRAQLIGKLAHGIGHRGGRGIGCLGHRQVDGRATIEAANGHGLLQSQLDVGDLAKQQLATTLVAAHRNLADVFRVGCHALAAQQDIALAGLQGAAWQITQVTANGAQNLPQGDGVRSQLERIHLDPQLPLAVTRDTDTGDTRNLCHALLDLVGTVIQVTARDVAVQAHADDGEARLDTYQLRFLRLVGQIHYLVNRGLRIAHVLVNIGTALQLDDDGTQPLVTDRAHDIDLGHALELFFNRNDDLAFHLLRRGAFKLDGDTDRVQLKGREHLLRHRVP